MKTSSFVKIALFTAALVLIGFYLSRSKTTASDHLQVAKVSKQNLEQRVTVSGQVIPKRRQDVRPAFSSYIQKIHARVGQEVKSGDPLVTFGSTLNSVDQGHPVRALFSGTVTQILKNNGDYVIESAEQNLVLRIDDLKDLELSAQVPELDIAKLKKGQTAKVRISSILGESFLAEIYEISLSAKDKERWSGSGNTEFMIRLALKKQDSRLIPGLTAVIDILTQTAQDALALPHEYILEKKDGYWVTLINGDLRQVTLGLQNEELAEIKSGLNEGDQVKAIDFSQLPEIKD